MHKRRVSIAIAIATAMLSLTACSDAEDPTDNDHARARVSAGHQVKEHGQFGGKYTKSTYWCENSDRQILDLWF